MLRLIPFPVWSLALLCMAVLSWRDGSAQTSGTFTDSRDSQSYSWSRLPDGKKWMEENLNYAAFGSWCYENQSSNCINYGHLYNWQTAINACPAGWRLPSQQDFENLLTAYGGDGTKAYKALISGRNGSFGGQLGGYYLGKSQAFYYLSINGYFWSSTPGDSVYSWYLQLYGGDSRKAEMDNYEREDGQSVRCLQD